MEQCPLTWSCCPQAYLRQLDRVQNRDQRLVSYQTLAGHRQLHFRSLEHRRDVAALGVLYKVHWQRVHLTPQRFKPRAAATHGTLARAVKSCRYPSPGPNFINVPSNPNIPDSGTRWFGKPLCTTCPACKLSKLLYTDGGPTILVFNERLIHNKESLEL